LVTKRQQAEINNYDGKQLVENSEYFDFTSILIQESLKKGPKFSRMPRLLCYQRTYMGMLLTPEPLAAIVSF